MTTKTNNQVNAISAISNEQMQKTLQSIANERTQSLGSLLNALIVVAKKDKFANLMLDTISGEVKTRDKCKDSKYINTKLKQALINAYPYKKGRIMLEKIKGTDLYKPIEVYTEEILEKAYYHKVGQIKSVECKQATPEQIAEAKKQANEKREATRKKSAATRAAKQNKQDLYKRFFEECMQAASANTLLEIRDKYKNESYQKDIIEKIDKANGK